MEIYEIDCSLLSSESNGVSRESFLSLRKFRNKKIVTTKFHREFLKCLQQLKTNPPREDLYFPFSGIKGIGKSTTLVYFMLECLKKKDESVHYIDLNKNDFKIENYFEYAKRIRNSDLLVIDHVTLFNQHHLAEIKKKKEILIVTVETGFTASHHGKILFGKDCQLNEDEFNQIWSAENVKMPDLGKDVYRRARLNGLLITPRFLCKLSDFMNYTECSLDDAIHKYITLERSKIYEYLGPDAAAGEKYQKFLIHSSFLLHNLDEEHGDILLTPKQMSDIKVAVNIFHVESLTVTKENLEQDSRFYKIGFEENDQYFRLSHLVPSFGNFWKERLPYQIKQVLESSKSEDLVGVMFQSGGGRKEIENLLVEVQKKVGYAIVPLTFVKNTIYEESENDCFIEQSQSILAPAKYHSLKLSELEKFNTMYSGSAKNVAKCAMWIKKRVESDPDKGFILHPHISNLMGVDYFCKVKVAKEGAVKKQKLESCLYLVQVATGSTHNGRTVGESLEIVKEVLAEMELTIHLVIAVILDNETDPYRLKKSSFKDASAINLASENCKNLIKMSSETLYEFISRVKSLNS